MVSNQCLVSQVTVHVITRLKLLSTGKLCRLNDCETPDKAYDIVELLIDVNKERREHCYARAGLLYQTGSIHLLRRHFTLIPRNCSYAISVRLRQNNHVRKKEHSASASE